MNTLFRFLFPAKPSDRLTSAILLVVRIVFGSMFLMHGYEKIVYFYDLEFSFPDPLGVSSRTSLLLAIFVEVGCSIGVIFGVFYRLALLPIIFMLCLINFVVLGDAPYAVQELSLVYLFFFIFLYAMGPGRYSIDRMFVEQKSRTDDDMDI